MSLSFIIIFTLFSLHLQSSTPVTMTYEKLSPKIMTALEGLCSFTLKKTKQGDVLKLSAPQSGFGESFSTKIREAVSEVKNKIYTNHGISFQTNESDFCFRGQRDASRALVSALERSQKRSQKHLCMPCIPYHRLKSEHDPVSQLIELHGYGIQTPLLDWTKNPDIALYFILSKFKKRDFSAPKKPTASLFILDPYSLNNRYRISEKHGIKISGLGLSQNLDAVIRAKSPFVRSLFYVSHDDYVRLAAENYGLMIRWNFDKETLSFFDHISEKYIEYDDILDRLSGPIAVVPQWSDGQNRMAKLENIFTIMGIFPHKNSASFFHDHTLKIDLDADCIKALHQSAINHSKTKKLWSMINKWETARPKS